MSDESTWVVNGWIPAVPVSTEVEAETPEEAKEIGQEKLKAEHGRVDVDEVVEHTISDGNDNDWEEFTDGEGPELL